MAGERTASAEDAERWKAVARLFAAFLLEEVTPARIRKLEDDGAATMLREMGLELPAPDDEGALEELAAEFFGAFVSPEGFPPPVQSLFSGGVYESAPAASMRAIADAAGLAHDSGAARGAPVDHLGCQLLLWSELIARDPAAAQAFAERHLVWARPLLARLPSDTFYGRLAEVVTEFIRSIC
ncbi:MAG TPA: hypothetical protein ENK43_13245 [Planctomycetes bacterium]|nr:hypothetical protein [Planctomycetota bacterium]